MSLTINTTTLLKEISKLDPIYNKENLHPYFNIFVYTFEAEKDQVKQVNNYTEDWENGKFYNYFFDKYGIYFDVINIEYIPNTNIIKLYIKMAIDDIASISLSLER